MNKVFAELSGFWLRALRVIEQSRGGGGFFCDGGMPLAEFLPDSNDDESEEHRVTRPMMAKMKPATSLLRASLSTPTERRTRTWTPIARDVGMTTTARMSAQR